MKVVIIGNGVAGVSVAKELRAREPDPGRLEIVILAREAYGYYSRIRLPEVLGDASAGAETLAMHKPAWYAERGMDIRTMQDIVAIDRPARRVILATGADVDYDVLVLALGSEPARPSLPGAFLPGVFTLREFDDAARIRAWLSAHPGPALVLGGGLLGLEAAKHLLAAGVEGLTVVEAMPRLLPRQLDVGGAAVLQGLLERMGMRVVAGARAAAFAGDERLAGLALESGETVPASTALVSMGVKPRVGIARAAGLPVGRGVVVDEFLRTADPAVYAVGDCAEFRGACPGIIPAALDQAPCCAAAILGDASRPYAGTIPSNTLKVVGVDLSTAGLVDVPEGGEEYRPDAGIPAGAGRYERYVFSGGALAGAIVLGDKVRARAAMALVGKPAAKADVSALPSGPRQA